MTPEWLWIPVTIAAAFLQNVRTALQKHLKGRLSTGAVTYTRFVYGVPIAVGYVALLVGGFGVEWPRLHTVFFGWIVVGSVAQIAATGLLVHVLGLRNFAAGVAYSKTEVIQAAAIGLLFLGETVTAWGLVAIVLGTVGVMLISLVASERPWRAFLLGWTERPALLGIASGGLFALSAVAFRAAGLSLGMANLVAAAAMALMWAQLVQTMLLTGWLAWREPRQLRAVFATWRVSALVGVTGTLGSACWFTAMTIQVVAYVRTLGLIELVFTFLVSRFVFGERPARTEIVGIVLLVAGIAMVLNAG